MMARLTLTLEGEELERVRLLAQAQGLSVEEWLHEVIRQAENAPHIRPHDVLFGLFGDEPPLAGASDDVVAERLHVHLREP